MRKSIIFIIATVLLFYNATHAQLLIGVNAGYTHNEFYTNISNYDYSYYEKEGGYAFSIPVQFAIRNWLALQAEAGMIRKRFSLGQDKQTLEPTKLVSTYQYLQVPIMAQFSFGGNKLRGFLNLGGYGAYWLSGKVKGNQPDSFNNPDYSKSIYLPQNVDDRYEFSSIRDRRVQFGWLAGGGLKYQLNGKFWVIGEYRQYQDQTDQQKNYMLNQIPKYNITNAFTAGFLYQFH